MTGLTTYVSSQGDVYARFFHTKGSIQEFLESSMFRIEHVKSYEEHLCTDFQRTKPATYIDSLIEVLASKNG